MTLTWSSLGEWTWEPGVILALAILVAAYVIALVRFRPRTPWDQHFVAVREMVSFGAGVVLLIVALLSPVDYYSDFSFSVHMLQHMLLLYLIPPLLLLGIPGWAMQPILQDGLIRRLVKFLVNPIVAIVLFNMVLLLWHLPEFWDYALTDSRMHALEHVSFLAVAIVAWWPIFSPVEEVPRMSYPSQMLYLFIQSLVPAIIGAVITFSTVVIYPVYLETPKLFGMTPLIDQQVAGLLMKLLGTIFLWILVTIRFFQWFSHEEHEAEKIADDRALPRR
ncbi:MAG TPA: cytochrome c oxidase assembly protein [Chloroflexota bacterium]|nr:cytochrome c oxidase assembly protein [Chloroflexota bacterium]